MALKWMAARFMNWLFPGLIRIQCEVCSRVLELDEFDAHWERFHEGVPSAN